MKRVPPLAIQYSKYSSSASCAGDTELETPLCLDASDASCVDVIIRVPTPLYRFTSPASLPGARVMRHTDAHIELQGDRKGGRSYHLLHASDLIEMRIFSTRLAETRAPVHDC